MTHRQLNKHLVNTGLAFFVDPGADATLGGMAATGASGTTAVRYGTMRETERLTVVLADGRVITTGGQARKSSAGYDLTRVFIGPRARSDHQRDHSPLHPLPEAVAAAVCSYPTIDAAVKTGDCDDSTRRARRAHRAPRRSADGRHQSLFEARLSGAADALLRAPRVNRARSRRSGGAVQSISAEHGGDRLQWVTRPEDRARLWRARHDSYYASLALRPGAKAWTTDACVPISRLADCVVESKRDLDESLLTGTLVGHVGDGNFHMLYLVDPDRPEEMAEAGRLNERLVYRAMEMGGTCSGEHGVGVGKMRYLAREHGEGLDTMRAIKHALDPKDLMNPGKIFAVACLAEVHAASGHWDRNEPNPDLVRPHLCQFCGTPVTLRLPRKNRVTDDRSHRILPSDMAHSREIRSHAHELKFLVDRTLRRGSPVGANTPRSDPHGRGPFGDEYRTASVYFDTEPSTFFTTAALSAAAVSHPPVWRRRAGLPGAQDAPAGGIGQAPDLWRFPALAAGGGGFDVDWPGYWFHRRRIGPTAPPRLSGRYSRMARSVIRDGEHVRLTLDSDLVAYRRATQVFAGVSRAGHAAVPDRLILELKFRGAPPAHVPATGRGIRARRRCTASNTVRALSSRPAQPYPVSVAFERAIYA